MSTREPASAQAFADQCRRWSRAAGAGADGAEAAAGLALRLDLALAGGDTCLELDATQAAAALVTGIVGPASAPGSFPLVVDGAGRLYLHRQFADERRLAGCLVRMAGQGRLQVIGGGPGTGKTSTVAQLLGDLLQAEPGLRVLLAAPTGKAAARLQEALRERAGTLSAPVRALLPDSAATIHRLLGQDARGLVHHHAGRPLPADVLVIDEASMLDLAMATRVCDALPEGARLVLLGDPGQLAAVESGAVLAELAGLPEGHPLRDCVTHLERQHRFAAGSAIAQLSAAVRSGDHDGVLAILATPDDALSWRQPAATSGHGPAHDDLTVLEGGFEAYWQALEQGAGIDLAMPAFAGFRVLCALRRGPWGAGAVGDHLDRVARARLGIPAGPGEASAWYSGRPVMVTRNDPLLHLYNGDVGIALPDREGELQVWFPAADGGFRPVAPVRLQACETAYATSVHKAQGSEFQRVAVVLPPEASPVLTRELLYTGLTRARGSILLIAAPERVLEAVQTPTRRAGGLRARIDEALAGR